MVRYWLYIYICFVFVAPTINDSTICKNCVVMVVMVVMEAQLLLEGRVVLLVVMEEMGRMLIEGMVEF